MSFSRYVSAETVIRATFNWHEPSFSIGVLGRNFTVYHTRHPLKPEPNLVVVESVDNPKELYFQTFPGKHSGECQTEAEAEPFFKNVEATVDRRFRVKGKELEAIIQGVIKKLEDGTFTFEN